MDIEVDSNADDSEDENIEEDEEIDDDPFANVHTIQKDECEIQEKLNDFSDSF